MKMLLALTGTVLLALGFQASAIAGDHHHGHGHNHGHYSNHGHHHHHHHNHYQGYQPYRGFYPGYSGGYYSQPYYGGYRPGFQMNIGTPYYGSGIYYQSNASPYFGGYYAR